MQDESEDIPIDRIEDLTPDQVRRALERVGELAAHMAEIQASLDALEGVELSPELAVWLDALVGRIEEMDAELELKMTSNPGLALVRRMKADARTALDSGVPADRVRATLLEMIAASGPAEAPLRRALERMVDGFIPGPGPGGGA
jgi:hypothetical protein